MKTTMQQVEARSTARAFTFYLFAGLILVLLLISFGPNGADLLRGMWAGVTMATLVSMVPVARWLKPNSLICRMLDDEGVREHRRISGTAGFWAAMTSAVALTLLVEEGLPISSFDTARVVATAAVVAALVSFATLELRAGRG